MGAVMVWLLIGLVFLGLTVGAAIQRHRMHDHLPNDLRHIGVDGLPSEASIRTGELGRATGSQVFRNMDGWSSGG